MLLGAWPVCKSASYSREKAVVTRLGTASDRCRRAIAQCQMPVATQALGNKAIQVPARRPMMLLGEPGCHGIPGQAAGKGPVYRHSRCPSRRAPDVAVRAVIEAEQPSEHLCGAGRNSCASSGLAPACQSVQFVILAHHTERARLPSLRSCLAPPGLVRREDHKIFDEAVITVRYAG